MQERNYAIRVFQVKITERVDKKKKNIDLKLTIFDDPFTCMIEVDHHTSTQIRDP